MTISNNNLFGKMSMDKMMGRMFRKVDNVAWDLMSGKLGIVTKDDEIATAEITDDDAQISINPFSSFAMAIPAFAQSTPIEAVKVGDLIYTSGNNTGWIKEIKTNAAGKKTFRLIKADGTEGSWTPPKIEMVMGPDSGVLVVRSLMNMFGTGTTDGAQKFEGFQGSLMMMMAMGGDNFDFEKMMPLMLMSNMGGGNALGGGGMMQTMMLMNMLGKDGASSSFKSSNPFR